MTNELTIRAQNPVIPASMSKAPFDPKRPEGAFFLCAVVKPFSSAKIESGAKSGARA